MKILWILFVLISGFIFISTGYTEEKWRLQPENWPEQDFETFYIKPDESSTLTFKLPENLSGKEVNYSVSDYNGKKLYDSKTAVSADGKLPLTFNLPQGWYEISFPEAGRACGISSMTEAPVKPDPYFGIDACMAWETKGTQKTLREKIVRVICRTGIQNIRDRLRWPLVFESDFETRDAYMSLAEIYRKAGLKVLITFHDTPKAIRNIDNVYPADLQKTAESWKKIFTQFNGYWHTVEAWNEPEIRFGDTLPADQYAPLVKTLAWALAESKADIKLCGGVLSYAVRPEFSDIMGASGVFNSVSYMSFHDYKNPFSFSNNISSFKKSIVPYGRAVMPVIVSEAGKYYNIGGNKNIKELNAEQEKEIAHYTSTKAVEGKASGLYQYYPFILTYMINWNKTEHAGLLKPDLSPARAISAYAFVIRELSSATYIGRLKNPDQRLRGLVFSKNGERLIVLYADTYSAEIRTSLPFKFGSAYGIDGRKLNAESDRLNVTDGMIYLHSNDPAVDSLTARENIPEIHMQQAKASPLVISILPDKLRMKNAGSESWICLREYGEENIWTDIGKFLGLQEETALEIPVKLGNLSKKDEKVLLSSSFSGTSSSLKVISLDAKAGKSAEYTIRFTRSELLKLPAKCRLTIEGKAESGTEMENAAMDLIIEKSLNELLDSFNGSKRLPIESTDSWTSHMKEGSTWKITAGENGKVIKMDFKFQSREKMDEWATPIFKLPDGVNLAGTCGFIVRARASGQENGNIVMILREPFQYLQKSLIPVDGKWHSVFIPYEAMHQPTWPCDYDSDGRLNYENVKEIQIGTAYYRKMELSLEISDIYAVSR